MLFIMLAQFASACDTFRDCEGINCPSDEEFLAQAGAVRLTPEQVRAHVAGRTEEWTLGGAYYHPDGELEAKWRRVWYKSTWVINDDGTLCYELPRWARRCHVYMDKDGDIYLLDEGRNQGVRGMRAGNKLRQLGRNAPSLYE